MHSAFALTWRRIGHFRDLQQSGVNYTQKSLISRRCEVLMWNVRDSFTLRYVERISAHSCVPQADFEEKIAEHNITTYITNPSPSVLYLKRKSSHLSSFFWKDTGIEPVATLSGLANVETLQRALLTTALQNFASLISLDNMTISAQQVEMHDYRKQLRAITSIGTTLPLWPSNNKTVAAALATVGQAYDGLGDTEDRISAYEYELKHGNAQSIATARNALDSQWLSLKAWLATGTLGTAENTLIATLLPF